MPVDRLSPQLGLLCEEYVLVQAWKKTAAYIRGHSWYADVLDLDRTAVDLPRFLRHLRRELQSPGKWATEPLRIVPAPKSQEWHIDKDNRWKPRAGVAEAEKAIRPLALVSLRDQVISTALLLCLADRTESAQYDPRLSITDISARKKVLSYGHRLFCDLRRKELRHRWGSSKLYRGFFQDYRRFLKRSDTVAELIKREDNRIAIVHADLSKFYDRVRPSLLHAKLDALYRPGDDPAFFELTHRALDWRWDRADAKETSRYATAARVEGFERVALPQGLVASGFFSNIVLLDFDQSLRGRFDETLSPGVVLRDACRYVDDLRLVVEVGDDLSMEEVRTACLDELKKLLEGTANGLIVSDDAKKSTVGFYREERRPLVQQSRSMQRIQEAVSGGFDATGGAEILAAIDGLFRTQERFGKKHPDDAINWPLSPVPDVRDETVARFGAGRYRRTFRSLRVLLEEERPAPEAVDEEEADDGGVVGAALVLSREELDAKAEIFAIGLIESWIADPANMRLLRIALDLYPDPRALDWILSLLRQYVTAGGGRKAPRRVAWYCLAELFRAGATETGLVHDEEFLPTGSDIEKYRDRLLKEAVTLLKENFAALPWYLKQQILLYIASVKPEAAAVNRAGIGMETRHYRQLILFLTKKRMAGLTDEDFVINAVLARRSYADKGQAVALAGPEMSSARFVEVMTRDPAFAEELLADSTRLRGELEPWILGDLAMPNAPDEREDELGSLGILARRTGVLQDESNLLRFAVFFLKERLAHPEGVIVPHAVRLRINEVPKTRTGRERAEIAGVELKPSNTRTVLYQPPEWCPPADHWRFELGMLLRYALTGSADYFAPIREASWREGAPCYRTPRSHWEQRLYGNFNGREAFGPSWLPISTWVEEFLMALLRWPGCRMPASMGSVEAGREAAVRLCEGRLAELEELRGAATGTLHLLHASKPPVKFRRAQWERPLRVCVAQTVIPDNAIWTQAIAQNDFELLDPTVRRRHRRHLAAMIAGVEQMLRVRETHVAFGNRLDWLILPELAVHPRDVYSLLVPFVRRHKCMVLAGLTYHLHMPGGSLINSALWLLPEWSPAYGLQIRHLEQGKEHLASEERGAGSPIRGFRPAQWLIGYPWNSAALHRPLILTASVCYDATDLCLAADLRDCSDIYAICALNRDVATFDTMTQALHYHMYQTVILSNNGAFGGSNAYTPYHLPYHRQVFHAHGQPQATVAFLEIEPAELLARGRAPRSASVSSQREWKSEPAGWRPRP